MGYFVSSHIEEVDFLTLVLFNQILIEMQLQEHCGLRSQHSLVCIG